MTTTECPVCEGSGRYIIDDTDDACATCKGTGTSPDALDALGEYIAASPGGEYIGDKWRTEPLHRVEVGVETSEILMELVVAAYPPTPTDEGESFVVPRTVANMLVWEQDEGRWFADDQGPIMTPEGWTVTLQVFATAVLNAEGEVERLIPPFDIDMDFAIMLCGPDSENYDVENDMPDDVAEMWGRIRKAGGGDVYAPHID